MPSASRIAIVPARGNSKGIPGKNLHPVAGRPLLDYTLDAALHSGCFDQVVVSSESATILRHAEEYGATPLPRPTQLSQDHVHSIRVVLHAIDAVETTPETVVAMLLPTSPLRTSEDVSRAVAEFEAHDVDSLASVYESEKHLLCYRRLDADGHLEPLSDGDLNVQRQDVPPLYVLNGSIYLSTAGALARLGSFHRGRVRPFLMDRRDSIDIDGYTDIADAELRLVS